MDPNADKQEAVFVKSDNKDEALEETKIDCCVISTNLQSRLHLTQKCIASFENQSHKFDKKIISVDMFPQGVSIDWFDRFKKKGWEILHKKVSNMGSMILNQRMAISKAAAEVVLYSEDDILIRNLPRLTTLKKLFNDRIVNGKKVGFVCFNNHLWSRYNENPKHILDFIRDINNYINVDGDVFLVKNDVIRDKYYLNFPVSITTKNLFFELEDYAFKNKKGWALEQALTSAWFETGKESDYQVLISLKPQILDDIKSGKEVTVMDFYNYANISFWNNDPTLRHEETPGRKEGCSINFDPNEDI